MIIQIGDRELNELRMHRAHARLYMQKIHRHVNGITIEVSPYASVKSLMAQYMARVRKAQKMGRRLAQMS